jgi:tRNA U55 pseudouridine synthase TruB
MYIWKYPIPKVIDEFTIEMPQDAKVLCVQKQKGISCIWVKTSGKELLEKRRFAIIGTGNPFDAEGLVYVGTWQEWEGLLVWHLFERKP